MVFLSNKNTSDILPVQVTTTTSIAATSITTTTATKRPSFLDGYTLMVMDRV